MKPIEFDEQTNIVKGDHLQNADGSPMGNLPAYIGHGQVISCWQATFKERIKFLFSGKVWLSLMVKGIPPQFVSVDYPFSPPIK